MMFSWFRRSRPKNGPLRLISVHIPKTAGTSFRNTLRQVYGAQEVIRLDIGLVRQETRINELIYEDPGLPAGTSVIHGHFSYPLLTGRFAIDPAVPVITWLRDPVDRVISNYYYLARRLEEELDEEGKGLNILKKMQRSLIEYARYEPARNRMTRFLEGLQLEDLRFVGLVEHYDEDLKRLSGLLAWPEYPVFSHNKTERDTTLVSAAEIEEIRRLNAEDIMLYDRAMNLREKGHWMP